MTKLRWIFVLIAAVIAAGASHADNVGDGQIAPKGWSVTAAAIDSSGTTWGQTYFRGGCLLRWSSEGWRIHQIPSEGSADSCGIITGPDGVIYCAWNEGENKPITITRMKNGISSRFAQITPGIIVVRTEGGGESYSNHVNLLFDDHGNLWCLHDGRYIYAVDHNGKKLVNYIIPAGRFTAEKDYTETQPACRALAAIALGNGKVWFFSQSVNEWGKWMRGSLVWSGKALVYTPVIDGIGNGRISVCGLRDPTTLWAGVWDVGLYTIDIATLHAHRMIVPDKKAFQWVEGIRTIGADTYVCAWSYYHSGSFDDLWRYRNGRWSRTIAGVDADNNGNEQPNRPMAVTDRALWVASSAGGIWYVPKATGQAVRLDWKRGIHVRSANLIIRLPGNRILTADATTQALTDNVPALLPKAANLFAVYPSQNSLLVDSHHHMWDADLMSDGDLFEWGETAVRRYIDPKRLKNATIDHDALDTEGRFWYLPELPQLGITAFFDPATSQFTLYDTYQQAITAAIKQHHPWTYAISEGSQPTFDAATGRALFTANDAVYYFDGAKWKSWTAKQIGKTAQDSFDVPHFAADGTPIVTADGRTYRLNGNQWSSTPAAIDAIAGQERQGPEPPVDSPAAKSESRAFDDSTQTWWFTEGGVLNRQAYGICKPVFADGVAQPFSDHRRINKIATDAIGRTWIETGFGEAYEYVVIAAPPPHRVSVDAHMTDQDSVSFTFTSPVTTHLQFLWRLDSGPWSPPGGPGPFVANSLPNGSHTVTVRSVDDQGAVDPTLATATFTVTIDTTKQIAALIDRLTTGSSAERNAAVDALAKQPAAALPALNAALTGASDDTVWWLKAAIQACDRASVSSPSATTTGAPDASATGAPDAF